jgi:hypothetical protein
MIFVKTENKNYVIPYFYNAGSALKMCSETCLHFTSLILPPLPEPVSGKESVFQLFPECVLSDYAFFIGRISTADYLSCGTG